MTLDQMADRIAGNASSPGEFLVRKQDALHYLNAVRCEGYRAGIEAAAKEATDMRRVCHDGREKDIIEGTVNRIRALSAPAAPKEE